MFGGFMTSQPISRPKAALLPTQVRTDTQLLGFYHAPAELRRLVQLAFACLDVN